jgi:hypothetical protein
MPASREYWQCARCGLSAHHSRLMTAATQEELRQEHLANLQRQIEDGRTASQQMYEIEQAAPARDHLAPLAGAIGHLIQRLASKSDHER